MIIIKSVEITQNLKVQRNAITICCVIFIILVFVISFTVLPNALSSFEAGMIIALVIVLFGGGSLIVLIWMLYRYRHAGGKRLVALNESGVKIIIPRKQIELSWDEFDTIHMFKRQSELHPAYMIEFIKSGLEIADIDLEISFDFSTSRLKKIRSSIAQYARSMNKDYYWGRKRK